MKTFLSALAASLLLAVPSIGAERHKGEFGPAPSGKFIDAAHVTFGCETEDQLLDALENWFMTYEAVAANNGFGGCWIVPPVYPTAQGGILEYTYTAESSGIEVIIWHTELGGKTFWSVGAHEFIEGEDS